MESSYTSPSDQNSQEYKTQATSLNTLSGTASTRRQDFNESNLSVRNQQNQSSQFDTHSRTVRGIPPHSSAPLQSSTQQDFDWTFGHSTDIGSTTSTFSHLQPSTSTLRHLPTDSSFQRPSRPSHLDNMSTIAIQQYDTRYDAGFSAMRQSYTWPSIDFDMTTGQQYYTPLSSPELLGSMVQYEEPKPIRSYSRADSASPPRGNFTSEQRESKRQQDVARRGSKNRYRRERSASNSYIVSSHPSPALIPGSVSGLTASVSPSPLLSNVTPALASPGYMTTFPPQITDTSCSDPFAPIYTMAPDNFSSPAYSLGFSDALNVLQPQGLFPTHQSLSSSSETQTYSPPQHLSPEVETDSAEQIRVVQNRPKPQCWDHGCNGRQFSTFSNLLRHQREKSGVSTKSSCPHCGAEFTRTTARNGHMLHDKCKQRKSSQ